METSTIKKELVKESSVFSILGLILAAIGMGMFFTKLPTLATAKADASDYFMVFIICTALYCIFRGIMSMTNEDRSEKSKLRESLKQ